MHRPIDPRTLHPAPAFGVRLQYCRSDARPGQNKASQSPHVGIRPAASSRLQADRFDFELTTLHEAARGAEFGPVGSSTAYSFDSNFFSLSRIPASVLPCEGVWYFHKGLFQHGVCVLISALAAWVTVLRKVATGLKTKHNNVCGIGKGKIKPVAT